MHEARPIGVPAGSRPLSMPDRLGLWLVLVLLIFLPASFGARHAWAELCLLVWAAAACGVMALQALGGRPEGPMAWQWLWAPVAMFLTIVALQVVPMPANWVAAISPGAAQVRSESLGDLSYAGPSTISLYPYATWHDLRLICGVTIAFMLVLAIGRRARIVERLLLAIAFSGGGFAAYALLQAATGVDRIYGLVELPGADRAGTLVNYNHFSQYLLMSLGAATGALFVRIRSLKFPAVRDTSARSWRDLPGGEKWLVAALVGVVVVDGLALANSASRGGVAAMFSAGIVVALLAAMDRRRRPLPSLMAMLGLLVVGAALVAELDEVYGRFRQFASGMAFRLQVAQDLLRTLGDFPLLGTGQGTHEVVYPMYQTVVTDKVVAHADGEYPQILAEVGIFGALAVAWFLAVIGRAALSSMQQGGRSLGVAAYGLGFALLAVLFQSVADFGQRRPVNACLAAMLCGLVLALWRLDHRPAIQSAAVRASAVRRLSAALTPLAAGGLVLGLFVPQAAAAWTAERHWSRAQHLNELITRGRRSDRAAHEALLRHARAAVDADPRNAARRYWWTLYRWRALELAIASRGPQSTTQTEWDEQTRQMIGQLWRVRRDCPSHARALRLEGSLWRARGEFEHGALLIRRAQVLAPRDPQVAFVAAVIEAQEEQWNTSVEHMHRAVQTSPRLFAQAVDLYVREFGRSDLAVVLAGDDDHRLRHVRGVLRKNAADDPILAQVESHIYRKLVERCQRPDAAPHDLADLGAIRTTQGHHTEALTLYRRALSQKQERVDWRLGSARVLASLGRTAEAIDEVRLCLQLSPGDPAARRLLHELVSTMGRKEGPIPISGSP